MAGRLRSGDKSVVTHVVGFALTAEEQETIGAIADEGKGRLIGAQNAAELTEALFSILEELEIVAGRGFVGGNAFSLLKAGRSGELSVVAGGDLSSAFGGGIPVVVRNNTGEGVLGIQLNGTAYDASGDLIAVGRSVLRVAPRFVPSGTVAFGSVYFGNVQLPEDARFEFEAEAEATPADRAIYPSLELDVAEASLFEDRVVGKLKNVGAQPIKGPVTAAAVCFDLDGNLRGHYLGLIDVTEIAPDEDVPFQVTVFTECPAFLVAAT